jgi:hypothetical protein
MTLEQEKIYEDGFLAGQEQLIKSSVHRAVNKMAQPELNAAIVQTLLPKLYSIIDRLLDGQDKALVIEARRVLPKAYKNSFEKGKGV